MEYVAGFMFDGSGNVALVKKNKPEWQKGKLNGIGGKIEEGEAPIEAMVREFDEETGCLHHGWQQFCTLSGNDFVVHFFATLGDLTQLKTMESEEIVTVPLHHISVETCIPNLTWLIPMALTSAYDRGLPFNIQESGTN